MSGPEERHEVYEILDGKPRHLAWCPSREVAMAIAYSLAECDPKGGAYYATYRSEPDEMVPGGGGHVSFQRDEDGRVERTELT